MRQIMNEAQDHVKAELARHLEVVRCEDHPDSRVKVAPTATGVDVKFSQCCETFKRKVEAALDETGAKPNVISEDTQVQYSDKQPLAFISHSSADTERIADPLDELLRARGIRVWLDKRDLLPGSNLVEAIFEQGISKSDAFIVILTKNSIDSAWVHEELTNAVVQKIDGVVKVIIPVILDDVKPPAFLKQTVWEVINDSNLPLHADRIAAAIIGQQPAPTAAKPVYAGIPVHKLPNLTADDERIFAAAVRQILDRPNFYPVVSFAQLFEYGQSIGMSEPQIEESLAALEQRYYFRDVIHGLGERYPAGGRISQHGMDEYLTHYMPQEYRAAKIAILSAIVNEHLYSSMNILHNVKVHPAIVEHVLVELEHGDHVIASHHNQGISIHPKATLPRILRELESEG